MQESALSNLVYPGFNFWEHDFPIKSILHPELTMCPRFSKYISNSYLQESSWAVLRKSGSDRISESSVDIVFFYDDDLTSLLC